MRRSDIWFFGTIGITLMVVILSMIFENFPLKPLLIYWWVLLLPYIPIKIFFRNSRLFKWLNSELRLW